MYSSAETSQQLLALSMRLNDLITCKYVCPWKLINTHRFISCRNDSYANWDFSDTGLVIRNRQGKRGSQWRRAEQTMWMTRRVSGWWQVGPLQWQLQVLETWIIHGNRRKKVKRNISQHNSWAPWSTISSQHCKEWGKHNHTTLQVCCNPHIHWGCSS